MNEKTLSEKVINATIEILGKPYLVRCAEAELASLQQAAAFLNDRMQEVKDSGKAINLERIAIMAALNISNQLLQADEQKISIIGRVSQKISQLQEKLDTALNQKRQTELVYTTE